MSSLPDSSIVRVFGESRAWEPPWLACRRGGLPCPFAARSAPGRFTVTDGLLLRRACWRLGVHPGPSGDGPGSLGRSRASLSIAGLDGFGGVLTGDWVGRLAADPGPAAPHRPRSASGAARYATERLRVAVDEDLRHDARLPGPFAARGSLPATMPTASGQWRMLAEPTIVPEVGGPGMAGWRNRAATSWAPAVRLGYSGVDLRARGTGRQVPGVGRPAYLAMTSSTVGSFGRTLPRDAGANVVKIGPTSR